MNDGVLVQGGKFRVFKDGTVFRIKKGKETKVKPVRGMVGHGETLRLTTSYSQYGKQKHYLISNLVAEAYLPIGENEFTGVKYLDGNPENCNISNLRRETKKDRASKSKKAHENARAKRVTCPICKESKPIYKNNTDSLCYGCFIKSNNENKRMESIRNELKDVNVDLLDCRQKEILNMRLEGKTLEEIGEKFFLTRERIRVILIDIKNIEKIRYEKAQKTLESTEDKIKYIQEKLNKTNVQKEILEKELEFLNKKRLTSRHESQPINNIN